MTDYFVDATGGDDGNAGTSSGAAWETINKVNTSSFSAGDNVYFKRGEVWRELLDIPSSGSTGNPITFGAYSTGAKPRITGSSVVSSFAAAGGDTTVAQQATHSFRFHNMGRDASNNRWAVSWEATETFDLTKISVWLQQIGTLAGGTTIGFEVWDDDSGAPGSLITNGTSSTTAANGISTDNAGQEVQFTFSTPPTLTSGNTYYFVSTHTWTNSTSNYMQWHGNNSSDASFLGWRIYTNGTEDDMPSNTPSITITKSGGSNTWEATVNTDPRVVYFVTDDLYGFEEADVADVNAAGDWHWDSNTLTVYATSDPSGDIEVGARSHAVSTNGQSYIEFDNIQFDTALLYTAYIEGGTASNINWTDCDFARGFEFNLLTSVSAQTDDCVVLRCTSKWAGAAGFQLNGTKDNWLFDTCTSTNDGIVDPAFDRGSNENDWGSGFKIVSDRTLDAITNIVFDNCTATDTGLKPTDDTPAHASQKGFGFWVDLVQSSSGKENIIRNSTATGCKQAGFFCEKSDYALFYRLVATGCGMSGLMVGGRLDGDPPPTRNNKFYHITLYGNGVDNGTNFDSGNLHVAGGFSATGNQVSDNTFFNIVTDASGEPSEAVFEFGGENDGTLGSNNRYEYLCFGTESTDFVEWGNTNLLDTYSAWDTAYQASTGAGIDELHYVNSAPGFVNAPSNVELGSGSNCIDAGVTVSGINDNYNGSAPDLGAFEFSTFSVSALVASLSVDTPTVEGSAAVLVSELVSSLVAGTAGISAGATVTPTGILIPLFVDTPTVSTSGGVDINVSAVAAALSVSNTTTSGSSSASANALQFQLAVDTPGVSGSVLVTAAALVAALNVDDPEVASHINVSATAIAGSLSVDTPGASGAATIDPDAVVAVVSIDTPTVTFTVPVTYRRLAAALQANSKTGQVASSKNTGSVSSDRRTGELN